MNVLDELRSNGMVSALDESFARTLARLANDDRQEILAAAALVSKSVFEGHVCVDLDWWAEHVLMWFGSSTEAWKTTVRTSALVAQDGGPFVMDSHDRIYPRRFWDDQCVVADSLRRLGRSPCEPPSIETVTRLLPEPRYETALRNAVVRALERALCVVVGGPGTGKTSLVVRLIAALIEHDRATRDRSASVLLLAPTGKAALRLLESVHATKRELECDQATRDAIPEHATTVHRALGSIRSGRTFRHGADNPLTADIVVVDEASMLDLSLVRSLLDALRPSARLILLGDRHQLASVEPGSVLADLCDAAERGTFPHCLVELVRTHRYAGESDIAELAEGIRAGDVAAVLTVFDRNERVVLASPERARIIALARDAFSGLRNLDSAMLRLRPLEHFRVLCAHREGRFGSSGINAGIERALFGPMAAGQSYDGRPIVITTNDHELGLFNGDTGVIALERPDRALRAVFPGTGEIMRSFAPASLPAHETAFAMTVHKSQGSEFDEVAIVLPERVSAVLTRELLYTAVTRARAGVRVFASRHVLSETIRKQVRRSSGLVEALASDE